MPTPAGNPFNLTVIFADLDNNPVDPASGITIKVKAPDGTITPYTYPSQVARVSTGTYAVTVPFNNQGRYYAVGYGTLSNGFQVTSDDAFEDLTASKLL